MKRDAEANHEPPVYTGKWSKASQEEVDAMLSQGAKPAYRFRVPKDKTITVPDAIRGDVSWNTDTLGDFIILRSDGSPVYNFCVAVDDALMKISHVIRAEEHLPNTLRQVHHLSRASDCEDIVDISRSSHVDFSFCQHQLGQCPASTNEICSPPASNCRFFWLQCMRTVIYAAVIGRQVEGEFNEFRQAGSRMSGGYEMAPYEDATHYIQSLLAMCRRYMR